MKRLFFLLIFLLTWYLAAMYHLPSLLVLALAEALAFVVMFLVCRRLKRRFRVTFGQCAAVVYKNQRTAFPLRTENSGRLPVGRFRVRLRVTYADGSKRKVHLLYAEPDRGEEPVFYLELPWCGPVTLSLDRVELFDYLSLFRAEIRLSEELSISVLPAEQAAQVVLPSAPADPDGAEEDVKPARGGTSGEFLRLREYAAGDPYRQIHWNQTARTGTLWIKEYQREQERTVLLSLDLRSRKRRKAPELGAFFEVLSALTLGILHQGASVCVQWLGKDGQPGKWLVQSDTDCRALLLFLYQNGCVPGGGETVSNGLCLTLDLALFSEGAEVFRFSCKKYAGELARTPLIL